jgi:hypothetical protein
MSWPGVRRPLDPDRVARHKYDPRCDQGMIRGSISVDMILMKRIICHGKWRNLGRTTYPRRAEAVVHICIGMLS